MDVLPELWKEALADHPGRADRWRVHDMPGMPQRDRTEYPKQRRGSEKDLSRSSRHTTCVVLVVGFLFAQKRGGGPEWPNGKAWMS